MFRSKRLSCAVLLAAAIFCVFEFQPEASDIKEGFLLLKQRKDRKAGEIFGELLTKNPNDPDALWGRAEILRRERMFAESEDILSKVLKDAPGHYKAKISLAYIRYHDKRYSEGLKIINSILKEGEVVPAEDMAMAYMLLGCVNADYSSRSILLGKITNGLKIRSNFEKAKVLAPDLPEVYLGLGSFYLKAPALFGGSLDAAIAELQKAIELTPDFATPYARLAEAYYRKGEADKSRSLLKQAVSLDAQNEAAIEFMKKNGIKIEE